MIGDKGERSASATPLNSPTVTIGNRRVALANLQPPVPLPAASAGSAVRQGGHELRFAPNSAAARLFPLPELRSPSISLGPHNQFRTGLPVDPDRPQRLLRKIETIHMGRVDQNRCPFRRTADRSPSMLGRDGP